MVGSRTLSWMLHIQTYRQVTICIYALVVLQKKARQLGISNIYELDVLEQLFQDAKVKPSVVQNRFYADTGHDHQIRAWCREQGIVYQSFWTLTANKEVMSRDTWFHHTRGFVYTWWLDSSMRVYDSQSPIHSCLIQSAMMHGSRWQSDYRLVCIAICYEFLGLSISHSSSHHTQQSACSFQCLMYTWLGF